MVIGRAAVLIGGGKRVFHLGHGLFGGVNVVTRAGNVSVQLFEKPLKTVEDRVESGGVAGEVGDNKFMESRCVPVLGAPEFANLAQAALRTLALRLTELRDQIAFQCGRGAFHPCRLRI